MVSWPVGTILKLTKPRHELDIVNGLNPLKMTSLAANLTREITLDKQHVLNMNCY